MHIALGDHTSFDVEPQTLTTILTLFCWYALQTDLQASLVLRILV